MNASRFLTCISPVCCIGAALAAGGFSTTSTPSRRRVSGLLVSYMPLATRCKLTQTHARQQRSIKYAQTFVVIDIAAHANY